MITSQLKQSVNKWMSTKKFMQPHKKFFIILILLRLYGIGINLAAPLLQKYAINNYVAKKTTDGIPIFVLVYGVYIVGYFLYCYYYFFSEQKLSSILGCEIRQCMFEKLQRLPLSYFDKTPTGDLMAMLLNDINNVGVALSFIPKFITYPIKIAVIYGVMAFLNFKLFVYILIATVVMFPLIVFFDNKVIEKNKEIPKFNGELVSTLNESVTGATTIKALGMAETVNAEFDYHNKKLRNSSIGVGITLSYYYPLMSLFTSLFLAIIVYRGGGDVLSGLIDVGTLSVFVTFSLELIEHYMQIIYIWKSIITGNPNIDRINKLLDAPEANDTKAMNNSDKQNDGIIGDVEFKNVTFRYPDTEKDVLKNFSLKVPHGTTIAFVGKTGAGKSTLVNLLCRFYEHQSGEILLDGKNIENIPTKVLRGSIGYLLQQPFLFSGTIRDNIAYGKSDATDEEVIAVAKQVFAHDFIMNLEKGYDTEIGEGGKTLSSGQKQLICIARVLLMQPKIFILDEATAMLDSDTEHKLKQVIDHILSTRTSFVIAHKLSTIHSADYILVLNEGKIQEFGTHDELLDLGQQYYQFYSWLFEEENTIRLISEDLTIRNGGGRNGMYK